MTFATVLILELFVLLIIKLAIFFGLIKLFSKKSKTLNILGAFFLYEVLFFVFYWIYYPGAGISYVSGSTAFTVIRFISLFIVALSIFLITIKILCLLSIKKSIIVFLLMFLIITPVLVWIIPNYVTGPLLFNKNTMQGRGIGISLINRMLGSMGNTGMLTDFILFRYF
ncbi:MAG: hypothetical protein PHS27_00885 [Candidatus Pacebacteria bacterium]|nr:hypothetical protein [Candidatus Paceibacterota bacterium]